MKIANTSSEFFGKKLEDLDVLRLFSNIYGDSGRYMQCLLNFLSNAIKFSMPLKKIKIITTLLEA